MEDKKLEEFKAKLKKINDDLIYFKPSQKVPQKYSQRRMTSKEARNKSGWRRGLTLGGSIK